MFCNGFRFNLKMSDSPVSMILFMFWLLYVFGSV
jgi:hypothetical protein